MLEEAWLLYPDFRLTQLLVTALVNAAPYYTDDDVTEACLVNFLARLRA